MKPKQYWVLLVISFLLAVGAASPVFGEPYDFGAVPVGQSAVGTFQVSNNGSSPIQVYLSLTQQASCGFSVSTEYLDVPANSSAPFQINFAPTEEVACSATFYAAQGWTKLMDLELSGTGSAPAPVAQKSKPIEPILLGECNTGVIDREYGDGMLSESVNACIESMDYRGGALKCLANLSKDLRHQNILNRAELRSLHRCAAKALIQKHRENRKNWHQRSGNNKGWNRHGEDKHKNYKLGWHRRHD